MSRLGFALTIAALFCAIVVLSAFALQKLFVSDPGNEDLAEATEQMTQATEPAEETTALEESPGTSREPPTTTEETTAEETETTEPQTPAPVPRDPQPNKFFAKQLKGEVPQYEFHEASARSCPSERCLSIETEAEKKRSLVLIVQDIILRKKRQHVSDAEEVWVQFYTPTYPPYLPDAWVFRNEAVADDVLSESEWRRATVINGVYLIGGS
jgi:hypothetical protein